MSKWPRHDREWGAKQVGAGWSPLIARFYDHIEQLPAEERPEVQQIKEKFGGLRIYFDWTAPYPDTRVDPLAQPDVLAYRQKIRAVIDSTHAVVEELEHIAEHTCEQCGAPGSVQNPSGWLLCLCEACFVAIKLNDGRRNREDDD